MIVIEVVQGLEKIEEEKRDIKEHPTILSPTMHGLLIASISVVLSWNDILEERAWYFRDISVW